MAYVERVQKGPLALLIHGFTDSSRSFSLIEPSLVGLSLIMPDLAGHGHSTGSDGSYEIEALAQDLASLMSRLGKKPDLIIGHSLGALIALRLASHEFREAAHLILLSGSMKPSIGDNPQLCDWISTISDPIDPQASFFDYWYDCEGVVPSSHIDQLRMEAAAVRSEVWRKVFRTLQNCDLTGDAEKVTMPTLSIAGREDKLFNVRHREVLCRSFRNRDHTHLLLEDVGHNPHWEQPKKVAGLISDFISRRAQSQS